MGEKWVRKTNKFAAKEKFYVLLCLTIFVLLMFRDVYDVGISKWVFLGISILIFAFYDNSHIAAFICFLIPFIIGLPNTYIFIIGLIIFILKNLNNLVINKNILLLLAIFALELLSFVYGGFSLVIYLKFVAPLLLISLIIFNDRFSLDYEKMLLYFIIATVGSVFLVLAQSLTRISLANMIAFGIRLGDTSELLSSGAMRTSFNPNELGLLIAIAISILLVFFTRKASHKLLIIGITAFLTLAGLMTLSREFLVLFFLIAVVFLISSTKSIGHFVKGLAIVALLTMGVYFTVDNYNPKLIDNIQSKLSEDDISGGRGLIANLYFDALDQHPERLFFGVGLQQYPNKSGVFDSCHNGLQEILVTWGMAGLILVAFFVWGIYKYGMHGAKRKYPGINILPLLILLAGVQAGQFFSSNATLYFLPIFSTLRLLNQDSSPRGMND